MPSTLSSAGWGDVEALLELRDDLADPPMPYTETWTGDGVSTAVRCQKWPVYDQVSNEYPVTLTVGGVAATLKGSRASLSASTDAFIEPDTGWVYFQTAPANAASIVLNHYAVTWTDRRLLWAVQAGLRKLFPVMGQEDTCTFQLQTLVWEYTLTPFQVWQDPRTRIMAVEVQEIPASTNRFYRLFGWDRFGLNQIRIPASQAYSPGSVCRVRYWGPYRSLSELEEQPRDLVLLYAKGRLLLDKAAQSARFDQPQPSAQTQQNDQKNIAAGSSMMEEFRTQLAAMARPVKIAAPSSSYQQ